MTTEATKTKQYCTHPDRDYTVQIAGEMQDVCESCAIEVTTGTKRRNTMSKTHNDAPPTLPVPAKAAPKGAPKKVAVPAKAKEKPDFKALREKAKLAKPFAKITTGVTNGEKYTFVKDTCDSVPEVLKAAEQIIKAKHGKGLREVIITFRG